MSRIQETIDRVADKYPEDEDIKYIITMVIMQSFRIEELLIQLRTIHLN
jgi:hypothetical protein